MNFARRKCRESHGRIRRGLMACGGLVLLLSVVLIPWTSASAASASVVYRGSAERRQIALTFDDNTSASRGVAVLRALQKNKVPATLFVIGTGVEAYPSINAEILKGMAAGLFEVGDHTRSHPVLTSLASASIAQQIGGGTDAFRRLTGARTVPSFRPPYGATDSRVASIAVSEGFRHLVLWDVDPRDWAGGSATSIADHVVGHAHNGAIVVMHLSAPNTAAAIPMIASRLRAKGYELVTVSTMLKGDRLFLDVSSGSEASAAIAEMVEGGYMNGYDRNYFGPSDTITRAQVAKVASLVGGIHTDPIDNLDAPTFADVRSTKDPQGAPLAYPFDFIEEAAAAGLVVGSEDESGSLVFRPQTAITRLQLAQIVARMARSFKGYQPPPPDADPPPDSDPPEISFEDVPDYAKEDVSLLVGLGVMTGLANGVFNSWSGAQRSQVAVVMSRYLALPVAEQAD